MAREEFDRLADIVLCEIPAHPERPPCVPPLNFKTCPTNSVKNRWWPRRRQYLYENCNAALMALKQKTTETKALFQNDTLSLREMREQCTAFQAAADEIRDNTDKTNDGGVFDTGGFKKLHDTIARDKKDIEELVTIAAVSVSDAELVKAFFTQHKNGLNSYWTGNRRQNATLRDIIHYANNGYNTGSGFFAKKYSGANTKKALQKMGVTDFTEQNVRVALESYVYPQLPSTVAESTETRP